MRAIPNVLDAELKFCSVDEESAMREVKVVAPAFKVSAPISMAPKALEIEPPERAPTEVKEEARIPPPKVFPFNTWVPPII